MENGPGARAHGPHRWWADDDPTIGSLAGSAHALGTSASQASVQAKERNQPLQLVYSQRSVGNPALHSGEACTPRTARMVAHRPACVNALARPFSAVSWQTGRLPILTGRDVRRPRCADETVAPGVHETGSGRRSSARSKRAARIGAGNVREQPWAGAQQIYKSLTETRDARNDRQHR